MTSYGMVYTIKDFLGYFVCCYISTEDGYFQRILTIEDLDRYITNGNLMPMTKAAKLLFIKE